MKKTLCALAVVWLCASAGCCRCWFKWPGYYEHNPSFSQCCEWDRADPFREPLGRGAKRGRLWGGGVSPREDVRGQCQYNCRLGSLFGFLGRRDHHGACGHDCGCEHDCGCGAGSGHLGGHYAGPGGGYGGPGGAYPGPGGMPHPGMPYGAYGFTAPGMMGGVPVSPEGIPLQPAPNAMSAAQIAYPYYTNRGPRDFLMGYPPGTQPPSIGP